MARVRAYAQIMPEHAFFIGPTAALIGAAPLPFGLHRELHVGVLAPRSAPRRPGIRGRQLRVGSMHRYHGLRVADVPTTWATLATHLDEYNLVTATDHIIRIPRSPGGFHDLPRLDPLTDQAALAAILSANRWHGAERLRRALDRARTGSSSRPETWLRLTIIDAGLPEPELDVDIFDGDGRFVACADLAYPQLRISLDYEGEGHQEQRRFEHDINRFARLAEIRWDALRFTSQHVFRDSGLGVARIRRALERHHAT